MKTHLAHIYRKLGVSTRDEAVAVATELGLLRW
jgi:ATP/maltotriose-dependent transcriptional regulator MalT